VPHGKIGAGGVLHRSGVKFRRAWKPPTLKGWEEPVADLNQPMVWRPAVLPQEDKKRHRERPSQRMSGTTKAATRKMISITGVISIPKNGMGHHQSGGMVKLFQGRARVGRSKTAA